MKCRAVEKKLSAYQDRELKPREQEEVARHLTGCEVCRAQYARLELVREALGGLEEIQPDSWFYRQVVRKINESHGQKQLLSAFERICRVLRGPVIASLILVIGLGAGGYFGARLAQSVFSPRQSAFLPAAQADVIASLQAFDPAPPGTFAAGYLRMASYEEDESR